MNEFTKEELKSLIGAFNWIDEHPSYRAVGGWDKELQSKIQSMFDNYCDHEGSDPRLVLVKNCVKCKCHLETRPWGMND